VVVSDWGGRAAGVEWRVIARDIETFAALLEL
jgi:hypothetical protein